MNNSIRFPDSNSPTTDTHTPTHFASSSSADEGDRTTAERERAYRALQHTAAQIGMNNFRNGLYRVKTRKGKVVQGYSITQEHKEVIEAMDKVMKGTISVEEALALTLRYDVFQQRFPSK
jgi:hypothetical protein